MTIEGIDRREYLSPAIIFLFICLVASIICSLYEVGYAVPLGLSLSLSLIIALWAVGKLKLSQFSLLTRFAILIYCLPLIHLFEYLFNPNIVNADQIWGLYPNPYQKI